MGATWLPGEQGKQYLNAYLNHDKVEVLIADGKLLPTSTGKDSLEVNTTLEHFPLRIANAFIPDELVTLAGDMDGDLNITGSTEQPLINGELILDSVSVLSRQDGANFLFDNRPGAVEEQSSDILISSPFTPRERIRLRSTVMSISVICPDRWRV